MPAALDRDWPTIRTLAESGVPRAQLAKDFDIDQQTIKQRSKRECWSTPKRVRVKVTAIRKAQSPVPLLSPSPQNKPENPVLDYKITNFEGIKKECPLQVASYVAKKVYRAIDGDTLPEITSWDRLQTAYTIFGKASGLDKAAGVTVQVGMWGGDSLWCGEAIPLDASSAIETEAEVIPSE